MSKASGIVKMMAPRKKVDESTRVNHIYRRRGRQARAATSLTDERCYCRVRLWAVTLFCVLAVATTLGGEDESSRANSALLRCKLVRGRRTAEKLQRASGGEEEGAVICVGGLPAELQAITWVRW